MHVLISTTQPPILTALRFYTIAFGHNCSDCGSILQPSSLTSLRFIKFLWTFYMLHLVGKLSALSLDSPERNSADDKIAFQCSSCSHVVVSPCALGMNTTHWTCPSTAYLCLFVRLAVLLFHTILFYWCEEFEIFNMIYSWNQLHDLNVIWYLILAIATLLT